MQSPSDKEYQGTLRIMGIKVYPGGKWWEKLEIKANKNSRKFPGAINKQGGNIYL